MVCSFIQTSPFLDLVSSPECDRSRAAPPFHCYQGYIIDLVAMLNESVGGFTLPESFYVVSDNLFGDYNETSRSWNGVVGDIVTGVSFAMISHDVRSQFAVQVMVMAAVTSFDSDL